MAGCTILRNYLFLLNNNTGRAVSFVMYMCIIIIDVHLGKVTALGVLCCFALFVCLTLLASFFLPSHLSFKNMYILGLVFGVIGGFITPAFSFILS